MRASRAAAATALVMVAALALASCSSDDEQPAQTVGEVVFARAGIDIGERADGFILLPTGRLDVKAGAPVDRIDADHTRERESRAAPDGGVFVPLSWTYDTRFLTSLDTVFGRDNSVSLTLVSDGERYGLAPPQETTGGAGSETLFVSVEGEAKEVALEVEYAGLTQTLDLRTGKRKAGRAKGLYELESYQPTTSQCTSNDELDLDPEVVVAFACTATRALATPFVSGQWAAAGHTFVVVGLTTNLSDYAIRGEADGAVATYKVATSRERTKLGGERPTRVLLEGAQGSINSGFLVFDIKGKIPQRLDYRRTYHLKLSSVQGDIDAKDSIKFDVTGRIPLGL